jgi:hypothetical protein
MADSPEQQEFRAEMRQNLGELRQEFQSQMGRLTDAVINLSKVETHLAHVILEMKTAREDINDLYNRSGNCDKFQQRMIAYGSVLLILIPLGIQVIFK